jgi:uncharacterized membrane protein YhaH (DUF805 family)
MILFALPLAALIGTVVFICFWPFLRRADARLNRFGSCQSAKHIGGAIVQGFNRCLDFKGRSSRLDFWTFAVFAGAIWLATCIAFVVLAIQGKGWWASLLLLVMWPIVAFPSLTLAVRRLHDINRSGWWILLFFVFGYFVLLYWFLRPSQKDTAELF